VKEYREKIETTIHRYLSYFEPANTSSTLRDIAISLGDLVRVYSETPEVELELENTAEAPRIDEGLFGRNAARFFRKGRCDQGILVRLSGASGRTFAPRPGIFAATGSSVVSSPFCKYDGNPNASGDLS
jgi:hypothetical protein